jgi:hypothetical protein
MEKQKEPRERNPGAQASLPADSGKDRLAEARRQGCLRSQGRLEARRQECLRSQGQLVLIRWPVYDSISSAIKIQIRRKQ